jgi:purine-nucleoside phosphorylase
MQVSTFRAGWIQLSNFSTKVQRRKRTFKSAFAKKYGKEFLLCFGVYGAVGTIELLQCLKDGGTKAVVFVGSIGAKSLPVGTIVLPVTVIDRAGIVLLDDTKHTKTSVSPSSLDAFRRILEANHVDFEEATIVSVPSVLHGVESILRFVEGRKDVAGVELELSTFYHFAKKLGMKAYALVYVQDNAKHGIIDRPESLQRIRREAYLSVQRMVLELLRNQV